jgi:hypothetical protein
MDMEHIKALYFHLSPPTLVMCVTVLLHKNTVIAIICTCAVSRVLLMSLCPPIPPKIIAHYVVYLAEYMLRAMCRSRLVHPFTMLIHIVRYSLVSALCAPSARYSFSPHACEAASHNHMLDPPNSHERAWSHLCRKLSRRGQPILFEPKCFLLEKEQRWKRSKFKFIKNIQRFKYSGIWAKKTEWSRLDQQYESVTLITMYQFKKTRDFGISSRRILQSREKYVVGLDHSTGADYTFDMYVLGGAYFVWPWKSCVPHRDIVTSQRGHWPLLICVSVSRDAVRSFSKR